MITNQMFKHKIENIKHESKYYNTIKVRSATNTSTTTPTTINPPSMNLRRNCFQMALFISLLRRHPIGHDGIDMVSDAAQPSSHVKVPMLSLLLSSNLIMGLLLGWSRDINNLLWKYDVWMLDGIKLSDVSL